METAVERQPDSDFVVEAADDLFAGDTLRAETPSILLLKFLWHEARGAGKEAVGSSRQLLKLLDAAVRPESSRRRAETEDEAKALVDGAFDEAGFSFETLQVQRSDGAEYEKRVIYRPGDQHPERCLVLSHGLTAGYESFYSVLGQEAMGRVAEGDLWAARDSDSPLLDYSIVLENRSGVDAESSELFVDTYEPRTHLKEQAAGQRASVEFARAVGATHIRIGGHSNGGMITLENMRKPLPPEVRGAVLINAPGHVGDSLIWKVPGMPRLLESLADSALSQADEGHWTRSALNLLPDRIRRVMPHFTPEEITRSLVDLTIERILGDFDTGSDIYQASRHRFKQTDWRIFVLDLHAMRHMRPLLATDHLINMHNLVLDSRHDRAVMPGVGYRLAGEIDPFAGTRHRTTDYKLIPAGHFPQAQNPDKMNDKLATFMAGERQS